MLHTKELQTKILDLFNDYGVDDWMVKDVEFDWLELELVSYKVADILVWASRANLDISFSKMGDKSVLEYLNLIRFLQKCRGSEIKIEGIVTDSCRKDKGQYDSVMISHPEFARFLEYVVHNMIYRVEQDMFEHIFRTYDEDDDMDTEDFDGEDFKDYVYRRNYLSYRKAPYFLMGFFEPFTGDELNRIDKYVNQSITYRSVFKKAKKFTNAYLGMVAIYIDAMLMTNDALKDNGTLRYSLIYDAMLLVGKVGKKSHDYEGKGREKYQDVYNWIKAAMRLGSVDDIYNQYKLV